MPDTDLAVICIGSGWVAVVFFFGEVGGWATITIAVQIARNPASDAYRDILNSRGSYTQRRFGSPISLISGVMTMFDWYH